MLQHETTLHRQSDPSVNVRDIGSMVFELYRDKVIDSYQAKEILIAMGFTTVWDMRDGKTRDFPIKKVARRQTPDIIDKDNWHASEPSAATAVHARNCHPKGAVR